MKQKIKLDELRIQSFITELDPQRADKARGGGYSGDGGTSFYYGQNNCNGGGSGTGGDGNSGSGVSGDTYSNFCSGEYDEWTNCI